MVALLVIVAASAGQLWLSSAQGVQASTPTPVGTSSEARLFDLRSAAAWQLVQKRLNELGFSTDKVDRANQVALTKWRDLGAKGMEWVPPQAVDEHYVAQRVRFEVFVSPFAEPAHVYVGSLIQGARSSGSQATVYNVPDINRALMVEIAKSLGGYGVSIPNDFQQRRQLVLSLLKDDANDCLRLPSKGGRMTRPQKIPLSEFEVIYPADASKENREGTVQVEFMVLEDGGVTNLRLLSPPLGYQFEASAIGAASLLLYSPAKLSECPTPSVMTYTVRYHQK